MNVEQQQQQQQQQPVTTSPRTPTTTAVKAECEEEEKEEEEEEEDVGRNSQQIHPYVGQKMLRRVSQSLLTATRMRKLLKLMTTQTQNMISTSLYSDNPPESEEDTEEEVEDTAGPSDNEWKSKKGQILWSPTPPETLGHAPGTGGTPGPTRYATSHISTLKSCFDLFVTEKIIKLLVDTTNVQGKHSIKDWKDLDATDMEAYIGILILAGVYRSRRVDPQPVG
ncbi:uncharacterized protein LOC127373486 [Dicentrarchus labrax]|uniref:uncharacterized protein LOC127373486 n=1 Tax=Dicentrarchus labrax TaxID=13489 RepID=UPI0021F5E6A2|nr:uncharacterized protein LOC127373486 [Dicentrarchus labrax]